MGDILAHFHIAGILLVSKHLLKSIVNANKKSVAA